MTLIGVFVFIMTIANDGRLSKKSQVSEEKNGLSLENVYIFTSLALREEILPALMLFPHK